MEVRRCDMANSADLLLADFGVAEIFQVFGTELGAKGWLFLFVCSAAKGSPTFVSL